MNLPVIVVARVAREMALLLPPTSYLQLLCEQYTNLFCFDRASFFITLPIMYVCTARTHNIVYMHAPTREGAQDKTGCSLTLQRSLYSLLSTRISYLLSALYSLLSTPPEGWARM